MDGITRAQLKVTKLINQLRTASESFFPQSGEWSGCCFQRSNELSKAYLPCHLRDNYWLSQLMHQQLKGRISQSIIQGFMNTSADFARLRHDYELRIVQWQINWIMDGGANWIPPKGFDELSLLCSPDIDKMVRGGVLKTLRAIGMNREVIEEGLEKYANQWRKASMERGYNNLFNPVWKIDLMDGISIERKPIDETHKANWMVDREYNYYQEHKQMVDKYGTTTPAMKMTPDEHAKLLTVLNQQNADRMALLAAKVEHDTEAGLPLERQAIKTDAEPVRKKTFIGGLIKKIGNLLGNRERE